VLVIVDPNGPATSPERVTELITRSDPDINLCYERRSPWTSPKAPDKVTPQPRP